MQKDHDFKSLKVHLRTLHYINVNLGTDEHPEDGHKCRELTSKNVAQHANEETTERARKKGARESKPAKFPGLHVTPVATA